MVIPEGMEDMVPLIMATSLTRILVVVDTMDGVVAMAGVAITAGATDTDTTDTNLPKICAQMEK